MNRNALYLMLCILSLWFRTPAFAATYYVSTGGSDSTSCTAAQNSGTPKASLTSAWGCLSAGDTLIVGDGTYSSAAPPTAKSGTATAPITVRAANDGKVTFPETRFRGNSYLTYIGMKFVASSRTISVVSNGKGAPSHHLTFQRISFNCTTTSTADDGCFMLEDGTHHVLLEDSWGWGGARYTVECYGGPGGSPPNVSCDFNTFRRVVLRMGPGQSSSGNPQAALAMYYASNNLVENVIVVDSVPAGSSSNAGFYLTAHGPPPNVENNEYYGVIALNNQGISFYSDSDNGARANGTKLINSVIWAKSGQKGINLYNGNGSCSGNVLTNVTVGSTGNKVIDYANCSVAQTANLSSGLPNTAGLKYILQRPGTAGADVRMRYENKVQTSVPLWPWPNEVRLKAEMCANTPTRGFCASPSLTDYIWNYLGNGNPYAGTTLPSAPSAPGAIRIIK